MSTKPLHPRMANTPEQVATLDDQSVVLRYRQLCQQVTRAAGLAKAALNTSHAAETQRSCDELCAKRDMFHAEATKRNLI